MIKPQDIYRKTNDGLDIIHYYYPESRGVEGTKNKFRCRTDERTPSACLLKKDYPGWSVWKVVDFGDDGHAIDPIDICKKEEGISRTYEAILKLAARYGVTDALDRSVNKPDVKKRPAREDEKDGTRIFALKDEIPEEALKVLGPKVTAEHAAALNWHLAEYVGYVKNREVTMKYSNENYPIFLRECFIDNPKEGAPDRFYKIYEPLNPDKGFRFSYTPAGAKPQRYVNGLRELRAAYQRLNAAQEAETDSEGNPQPVKEKKLDEVIICSGERDALCCKSMGYQPVWFNSETYKVSDEEMRELKKYATTVYNVPDIDETGIKKGTELAFRFIEVCTIWLPQELRTFKDNRGKARKDLRDWMELRDRVQDFKGLIELARPIKFWVGRVNQKTGKISYEIDPDCLYYFLRMSGFHILKDDNAKDPQFIRIDGNTVRRVLPREIRRYLNEWAEQECLPRQVRNLICTTVRIVGADLENLGEVDLDFSNYTKESQIFYFGEHSYEVNKDGITERKLSDGGSSHYVWDYRVLPHMVKLLPDMFTVTRSGGVESDKFDLQINGEVKSPVLGYLINSSRLYWRKELEENFAERGVHESEAYARENKFRIDGEGLTDQEIAEQKQNLLSKIFTVGYILHRYKSLSRPWAPIAMDNKIGEDGECNGRSGKSFLFHVLGKLQNIIWISGRNRNLLDNQFLFERVDKYSDVVFFDDCGKNLSVSNFYDIISGDMTINAKNVRSYSLPFEEAPKFAFTTNYVPTDFNSSTEARMLYLVYSDYYHQMTSENDYLETRSIRDDFGRDLFGRDYPEELWNADLNFLMQCCKFYLSLAGENIKIQPPMGNILKRKYKADMGANFEDWANTYFAEEGGHLDELISRREAYEAFIDDAKVNKNFYTMNRFTRSLRAFAQLTPYVAALNPAIYQNNAGRIIRRVDGRIEEMLLMQSVKAKESGGEGIFIPDEAAAPF